jgi:hypothetical protein
MNRLGTAMAPDAARTETIYGYDGAGNRTYVKVGSADPINITYDGGNLPLPSADGTYTYDQVGNLIGCLGRPIPPGTGRSNTTLGGDRRRQPGPQ